MRFTKYKPLDEDCYEMEEYTVDTGTGKSEYTGRKYRKVGDYVPNDSNGLQVFAMQMKANKWIILHDPKTLKPYPYELLA